MRIALRRFRSALALMGACASAVLAAASWAADSTTSSSSTAAKPAAEAPSAQPTTTQKYLALPPPVKQIINPKDQQMVDRLDGISTEVDDTIIAFSQDKIQVDQAKQRFNRLMIEWLNLYQQFGAARIAKTLGKAEYDFYQQVNANRPLFLQRYSNYLLGDKTAMTEGELILIDRLVDSAYKYLEPMMVVEEGSASPAPAPKTR